MHADNNVYSCNYAAAYLTILYVLTTAILIFPKVALKSVNNLVQQNRTKLYTSEHVSTLQYHT